MILLNLLLDIFVAHPIIQHLRVVPIIKVLLPYDFLGNLDLLVEFGLGDLGASVDLQSKLKGFSFLVVDHLVGSDSII
eukprot:CAMPEP_0170546280 /NCGR_PEP_ID=MMETSP0211-20121228/4650_1 /TAXON_ID=311385 /ORGANISM="Pseudokeronopsis sp., Strain OXSARD2" /LENGTH=77 /DNA_ID=CAMNT_0010850661 /DNA_START=322 /DNA_END=555 /DNA_ORIENTATION=-